MIDPAWERLIPQVIGERAFQDGVQAGMAHWWDEWRGEGTPEEIRAFLDQDWSYTLVMRRNEQARASGLPILSEAYAAGFVFGWAAAVFGE